MPEFALAPMRIARSARPTSRYARRRLVIAMYAGYAALLVVTYLGYTSVPRWPSWLAILAIITFLATGYGFVRVAMSPGYVADTLDRHLDERQRLVRDRAYRVAYYGISAAMLVLSLVVLYAAGDDQSWSTLRQLAPFGPWLAFVVGSLPTAIVAWSEPDAAEDPLA